MPLKVIGAGFGRTGTTSLRDALEILGFSPCHHMRAVFKSKEQADYWRLIASGETPNWHAVYAGYEAAVDWPTAAYYEELMEAFPDAKVILTIREAESWYRSTLETIYKSRTGVPDWLRAFLPAFGQQLETNKKIIWEGVFENRFEDREHAVRLFNAHNERVKVSVPRERLLIHEAKDGWGPLCRFLECEQPSVPYPHKNDTKKLKFTVKIAAAVAVTILAFLLFSAL